MNILLYGICVVYGLTKLFDYCGRNNIFYVCWNKNCITGTLGAIMSTIVGCNIMVEH